MVGDFLTKFRADQSTHFQSLQIVERQLFEATVLEAVEKVFGLLTGPGASKPRRPLQESTARSQTRGNRNIRLGPRGPE